jgi:hypothetical protein
MYKVAPAPIGLYYGRGVQVMYDVKDVVRKVSAVRTKEGKILIQDRPDLPYAMTMEEIRDTYGGEIIEIEVMNEVTANDSQYVTNSNFPKVKDRSAIERAYQRYKKYMNSLGSKKK